MALIFQLSKHHNFIYCIFVCLAGDFSPNEGYRGAYIMKDNKKKVKLDFESPENNYLYICQIGIYTCKNYCYNVFRQMLLLVSSKFFSFLCSSLLLNLETRQYRKVVCNILVLEISMDRSATVNQDHL